jgi:hypothetical protein
MPNEFASNFAATVAPFDYLIRRRDEERDRAEGTRRFDATLAESAQRSQATAGYYDTLRMQAEIRQRAMQEENERFKRDFEESAAARKRMSEIDRRIWEASKTPGNDTYLDTVADALYQNPDLASSNDPYVRQRTAELGKQVQMRLEAGRVGEDARDAAMARKMGITLEDYRRKQVEARAVAAGFPGADKARSIPATNGVLDPVETARLDREVQVHADAQKRMGGRVRVTEGLGSDGKPIRSVSQEYDINDPRAQEALNAPQAGPVASESTQDRLVQLNQLLGDLKRAAKANPNAAVDAGDLRQKSNPKVDANPWWGKTVPVNDAIADIEQEIRILSGGAGAAPQQAAQPPAEQGLSPAQTNAMPDGASTPMPVGTRVRQNGVIFEWNGTKMVPVK